ncbi:hypothetical protein PTKIN_Ptkin02bG0203900 [Pterospermum kingtungense]
MGFNVPPLSHAKQIIRRVTAASEIPKGHLAVYLGGSQKRHFVIPDSFMETPFQELLNGSKSPENKKTSLNLNGSLEEAKTR